MSYAKCVTSLGLNGKIPARELKDTAAEYQAEGMPAEAALLRAVEEKLELMVMEERKIVKAVRSAYEADGGKKAAPKPKTVKAKAAPAPEVVQGVGEEAPAAKQPAEEAKFSVAGKADVTTRATSDKIERSEEDQFMLDFATPPGPNDTTIRAVIDGKEVGYLDLAVAPDGKTVAVREIHVDQDQRRKGVATALMDAARAQGFEFLPSDNVTEAGAAFRSAYDGAKFSVSPEQAAAIDMETKMPSDPLFDEAVANTPGASVGPEGLRMTVVRYQLEEQEGARSVRTGVFYLPEGSAAAKHYKTGKTGYGGTEKFEDETVLRAPIFVKGATGGKAPEAAYDAIKGKKAYEAMRTDVLRKIMGYGQTRQQKVQAVEEVLDQYGADSNLAYEIVANSTVGNTLAYAVQENIVAHAVRAAGYDSVVGYSKTKAGAAISEVFDVREATYPARGMESDIHPDFPMGYYSVTDDSAAGAIADLMEAKEGEAVINRPGVGDITVIYGDEKSGLAHIAKRRGASFMDRLPALLRDGAIYRKDDQPGRIFIGTASDEAVIRLDWNGEAKNWLLSAYEKYPNLKASTSAAPAAAAPAAKKAKAKPARPAKQFTKENLRQSINKGVLGKVIESMIEAGTVVLHDGPATLPKGAGKNVNGVQAVTMPDGTIHLVANSLNARNALPVMLHEAFHQGAEKLIGSEQWSELMGRLGSLYRQSESSSGKAREFFDKARERVAAAKEKGAVSARMEVEEFAAYAIEEYESAPATVRKWIDDLVGLVKAWMLARFGKQLGNVTPAQLSALAKVAIMDAAYQRRGEIFGPMGEIFSVGKERTIEVDGVRRPITNSEGDLVGQDFAEQMKFWKWFDGSKVVDESGKPLVVYHGTPNYFDKFDFGGRLGWFSEERKFAEDYSANGSHFEDEEDVDDEGHVVPATMSIKNPLVIGNNIDIDDQSSVMADVLADLGLDYANFTYDFAFQVVDNPRFVKAAKAAGYDGIQAIERGTKVWAAFNESQVRAEPEDGPRYSAAPDSAEAGATPNPMREAALKRFEQAATEAEHWLQSNGKTADISALPPAQKLLVIDEMMGMGVGAMSETAKAQGRAIWERLDSLFKRFDRFDNPDRYSEQSLTDVKQPAEVSTWSDTMQAAWKAQWSKFKKLAKEGSITEEDMKQVEKLVNHAPSAASRLNILVNDIRARVRAESRQDDGPRYSVAADDEADADADEVADPDGYTPPPQGLLRRLQSQLQDNLNRLKQVQEKIATVSGNSDLGMSDYYGAEANRPGRIAARLEDAQDQLTGPLMERLAKSGYKPAQLNELLHAMHAEERNERVASINDAMPDGGSGMTTARANQLLEQYKNDTELHELADQARAISMATLDLKLHYGLIMAEDYDKLVEIYENYVPLKGDGEFGAKIKRAMGHDAREEFILDNIARDYDQAVTVGEKNLARQSLLRLALQYADPKLWTVGIPPKGRFVAGKTYTVKLGDTAVATFTSRGEVNGFLEAKGAKASQYTVVDSAGERVAEFTKQLQDNEIMVYLKGKPIRIQIHDEQLAAQLRPLNGQQLHPILNAMRSVNRYLSKIYTGYNPAFILRNAARDAMTGTINMMGNQGAVTAAQAWTNYPAALATLGVWAATKKIPSGLTGNYLNEYRQQGGKVGASWLSDLEAQGKTLQRMYDDAYGVSGYVSEGKVGKASIIAGRKMVGGLAHVVEVANQATENALRLSLFIALREQGVSPGKAAQAAKGVTVDFDRKGTSTGALGAIYLFFNPAVQGTANGIKTLMKGEKRAQAWAAVGSLAALAFFTATKGMDEDKDRWLGEGWETRARNWMLTVGGKQIRVPISQEFAPFYAFGAAIGEASRGESKPMAAAHVVSSFIDAYFPLQGAFKVESDNHMADLGMSAVPTVLLPYMQSGFNRSSFGGQIVPESPLTRDRADNLKMNRVTKNSAYDVAAQKIAAAGVASGISGQYENDITKVSPETIKHFWRTYTGGLGQFVGDVGGLGMMMAEDPGQTEVSDYPFAKDFVKPNDVKAIRGRYYDLAKTAQAAATEFELARKAGDDDALAKLGENENKAKLASLGRMVRATTKAAAALRDEQVDINGDATLTTAQKREQLKALEKQEEELYRTAIDAFK